MTAYSPGLKLRRSWLLPVGLLFVLPWLLGAATAASEPCDPAAACFDTSISLPNAVGDFYVDGALVAGGVNSTRITTTPDVPHTIEVRNLQDPGVPGYGSLFIYQDLTATQQTIAGRIWRVIFYPRQFAIRGTLRYVCQPFGVQATDVVDCRPTVDGVPMPDVAAGGAANYVLDPGPHTVRTDLGGDSAGNWSTNVRDDFPVIVAGRFTWMSASFALKGLLKMLTWPAGLVADIYVDGSLIAPQATAAQLFTTPQVPHTVEARNVVDPVANGRYRFDDFSVSATTFSGSTRFVYLRPPKVWLQGTLSVLCVISRKTAADDAECQVNANGGEIGRVPAGGRGAFSVAVGPQSIEVVVVGGSADRWEGPVARPVTIFGGGTTFFTARFNLRPSAPPPAPVPVGPPAGVGTSGGFELGGQVAGFDRPDLMAFAGMTWVKRQVRWSPGAGADAGLINDAHAKGFKILLSVLGSPGDIAGGANYGDYARFVGDLARMGADGIEVWNEMNIDREWPVGEINPFSYTDLLRQSYNQIKANNPGTMVVSGALAPTGAEGIGLDHVWNDDHYISGLAAAGAARYLDCIGIHYNEGIISPFQSSGDPRSEYYSRYYSGMVNLYYGVFNGGRKLCFTELGYLTPEGYGPLPGNFGWAGNTSVAQQAQWLAQAATIARNSGIVRLMIVFNVDLTQYGDDPQGGYAMIRPGGGCPACDSLRAVTGGR
jgi:hypothetical protein